MLETVRKDFAAQIALAIFFFFTVWWILLQIPLTSNNPLLIQYFGSAYGIMAICGAIAGLRIAGKWGGMQSVMGKALTFFAFGLLAQEFGQLAYTFYIYVLHVEVPFPSIGDIGYFGSIPLYILGVINLARASGVRISVSSYMSKFWAIIVPAVMIVISYLLFLKDYTFDLANPIATLLNFGYPLGQAIYISLAILTYLLSQKVLGGMMKGKILFLLFALLIQYLSDYVFLYQVNTGTWHTGGINEFMYLLSYFLMSMGLIQVGSVLRKLRTQ